jgi:nicotinamide-nucleotide amidase
MEEVETRLSNLLKDYLFGYGDDDVQTILGKRLQELGWTISTAESCTGGTIGHLITSVPGSSAWYAGSTITYSYESKTRLLGVPADLIHKHGAVSEEVVMSMARNVREKLGTDCAVATSGVAGPGGGTPEKPVGTVWIGVALPDRVFARKLQLGDNRLITIRVASESALHFLRKALE